MSEMKRRMSLDHLTEEQKELIKEIILFLKERPNIPFDIVEAEMKQRFNLEQIPMNNIASSAIYKNIKSFSNNINISFQGYVDKKKEDGSIYRDPFLDISGELEQFEQLVETIKNQK